MITLPIAVAIPPAPPWPVLTAAAAFGLVFGSFTTALSYRVPRSIGIADGRSRCPACQRELKARDLVPVLSWAINRGRCAACGAPVSARYPVIEIISMLLFVGVVWFRREPVQVTLLAVLTPPLLALAVVDIEHRFLPNALIVFALPLILLWRWYVAGGLPAGVLAAAAIAAVGYGVARFSESRPGGAPGLIGLGDVKVLALAALALPLPLYLVFLFSAGALGIGFGAWWRWAYRERQFPFGPAILLAMWALMAVPLRI